MNCQEYAGDLMELARGREIERGAALRAHLEQCGECAARLDAQRAMQAVIERVAAEPAPEEEHIPARVMAEFERSVTLGRGARRSWGQWVYACGLAASFLLAAVLTLRPTPVAPRAPTAEEEAPFVTIPYTIPLAPEERAEVVRMRIPVTALLAAGFHVRVADPSTAIDADVLVSQDGRARAIRPLTVAISD